MITQSNYIPWRGYFDAIRQADVFIFYDDMQYTRRDWRNRNKIKTPKGLEWLTIAVQVKDKFEQKIKETKVVSEDWGAAHWQTIRQNYSKAPFFKEYKDFFEDLYHRNWGPYLSEINIGFASEIMGLLGINTPIMRSSDFSLVEGKTERLVDLCQKVGATRYLSGPAAKDYMDLDAFSKVGIGVGFFDYSGYAEYPQLYGDFRGDVSIVDLIFNVGAESKNYILGAKPSSE